MNAIMLARLCAALTDPGMVPADRHEEAKRVLLRGAPEDIGLAWSAEDVKEVCPELTRLQCRQVLDLIAEWDLAGMSCDFIGEAVEELFGKTAAIRLEVGRAEGEAAYAGAVLPRGLARSLTSLSEFACRLERMATGVRAMASAGIRLAAAQCDPLAVVVVTDDAVAAARFGLEALGQDGVVAEVLAEDIG